MERVIEISREEYDAMSRDRIRAENFVWTLLAAMDDGEIYTTFDNGTVLAALKAMYPEEYAEEMRRRHAVETPLYEIKMEGKDGNN